MLSPFCITQNNKLQKKTIFECTEKDIKIVGGKNDAKAKI